MNRKEILLKINERLNLIDEELKIGFNLKEQNEMVIEETLKNNLPIILNTKSIKSYVDYHFLEKACKEIHNTLNTIKQDLEINNFFSDKHTFDTVGLKKKYQLMNLKQKFPKFNIDKYLELLLNPILEYTNYNGTIIKYDKFWVRKMYIAINQMIFNEMDIYILNIGKEGSGKSCLSSQQITFFYKFLFSVGLIDYDYTIKNLFFTDISRFLESHENQKNNDYFRIECLDEGNELNRSNYREQENQQFKYEMRTERKMLRIIIINMQQIGELDTSISLSRVNFIHHCKMESNKKLGTLNKGFVEMYIIPRSNNIYSYKYKKIFSRTDILNIFATKLEKKKDYYVGLPNELIIKEFKFNNIWGFDKVDYDKHVKDEMQRHKFQKGIKLTTLQAYLLLTKMSDFTKLGTFDRKKNKSDKAKYDVLFKFFEKIRNYFENNPERIMAIERFYGKIYK